MASYQRTCICLMLFMSCLITAISARLVCEDLPRDLCAFSVSSWGRRCVLEKTILINGDVEHQCQTSEVGADEFAEWVETDECIQSCGLNRMSIGISSDALVERGFAKSLCSASCHNNCPNVVDLFTNLAAGEGVSLKWMCEEVASDSTAAEGAWTSMRRREMGEVVPQLSSVSSNTLSAWELLQVAGGPTTSAAPFHDGQLEKEVVPAPTPAQLHLHF